MLRISRKLDYALISLVHLARSGPANLASARDIAATYRMPLPITAGILKTLARCNLVQSIRGAHGGYRLARPAEELSLARIVEAIEGPLKLAACVKEGSGRRKPCTLAPRCPVINPIQRLHEAFIGILTGMTLGQLAGESPVSVNVLGIAETPCGVDPEERVLKRRSS